MTCPDIFVLLVYLTWRCDLQGRLAIQMEKRDGIVLEVNATCSEFDGHRLLTAAWSPCIHYSLRHSVMHCRQGYNVNAENTEGFPGLSDGLGGGGCFTCSREQLNCSSRRCTNNLQAAPWLKSTTIKLCILASRYASSCHCRQRT